MKPTLDRTKTSSSEEDNSDASKELNRDDVFFENYKDLDHKGSLKKLFHLIRKRQKDFVEKASQPGDKILIKGNEVLVFTEDIRTPIIEMSLRDFYAATTDNEFHDSNRNLARNEQQEDFIASYLTSHENLVFASTDMFIFQIKPQLHSLHVYSGSQYNFDVPMPNLVFIVSFPEHNKLAYDYAMGTYSDNSPTRRNSYINPTNPSDIREFADRHHPYKGSFLKPHPSKINAFAICNKELEISEQITAEHLWSFNRHPYAYWKMPQIAVFITEKPIDAFNSNPILYHLPIPNNHPYGFVCSGTLPIAVSTQSKISTKLQFAQAVVQNFFTASAANADYYMNDYIPSVMGDIFESDEEYDEDGDGGPIYRVSPINLFENWSRFSLEDVCDFQTVDWASTGVHLDEMLAQLFPPDAHSYARQSNSFGHRLSANKLHPDAEAINTPQDNSLRNQILDIHLYFHLKQKKMLRTLKLFKDKDKDKDK